MEDHDYLTFIQKVKERIGIDLGQYKEAQMKRRLTSLREKRGFKDFRKYLEKMLEDPQLKNEFLDRITINVSEFYRNPNRWHYLDQNIIPKILERNKRPRFWSAACSSGEEPYTLALILSKYMRIDQIDILATDIDMNILEKAKAGIYQDRFVKEVPPSLLEKYFSFDGSNYTITSDIKNRVRYKQHNLLSDPFEGPFDLIICRNVMIYFTDEAKDHLYHKFSQALRPGGFFFVGSTEQIFQPHRYKFEPEAPFFYRKAES